MLLLMLFCMTGCGRAQAELFEAGQTETSGVDGMEDTEGEKTSDGKKAGRAESLEAASGETLSEEASSADENSEKQDSAAEGSNANLTPAPTPVPTIIYVDVCGAVAKPGVYELKTDSRVFEAIEAAGGFLPEASGASINQAQPLSDGQQIYVPTQEEAKEGYSGAAAALQNGAAQENGAQNNGTQSADASGEAQDGRVNLNTATLESLMTLPGIGESKAQAILSYREEAGGFSSVEDIMQVPGIKEGTFAKFRDRLTVD